MLPSLFDVAMIANSIGERFIHIICEKGENTYFLVFQIRISDIEHYFSDSYLGIMPSVKTAKLRFVCWYMFLPFNPRNHIYIHIKSYQAPGRDIRRMM